MTLGIGFLRILCDVFMFTNGTVLTCTLPSSEGKCGFSNAWGSSVNLTLFAVEFTYDHDDIVNA